MVVSEELPSELDFGNQFVGRPYQRDVVVTNMGRKGVQLTWANTKLDELIKAAAKQARATNGPGVYPLTLFIMMRSC